MELDDLYVNTLINTLAGVSEDIKELTKELKELSDNPVGMFEYEGKSYSYLQHQQIVKGIEEGVDVSFYDDPEYDDLKMTTIRSALNRNVKLTKDDITPKYDLPQLFQVIRAKQSLIDCPLLSPSMPADKMNIYISACSKGVDIVPFLNEFDAKRLEIILECLVNNYDVNKVAIAGLSYDQMKIVYDGLERNLDVSQYNSAELSKDEMIEKYENLLRGDNSFSLSYYCLPSDASSEFEHEYENVEDAVAYRNATNGSVGVIITFNNILRDSRVFETYQLLNSYNELNTKSIDELFEDVPYLKQDESFINSIKNLISYSHVYVPDNVKEKYLSSLPEYHRVSDESIGGNNR